MPARKTKGKAGAKDERKVRAEERAAAHAAVEAATIEAAAGLADEVHAEDEVAAAVALSASAKAAAARGARDSAEGTATLSLADQVAVGGELAAALSSDEFRRGMELAGIAGQVQVAAALLRGIGQPTLASFLGRTGHQLHTLAVEALSRATEGALVAHGAEHLAGELAALGLTEIIEGREEYATSEALGVGSADMASAAVQSVATGAAELAAAQAMDGLASELASAAAAGSTHSRAAGHVATDKGAATPRTPKPATRAKAKPKL
jgi:hypothetical protein